MNFEVDRKAIEKRKKLKMTAKDGVFKQEFGNSPNQTILSEVASIKLFFQKQPKNVILLYVFTAGNILSLSFILLD